MIRLAKYIAGSGYCSRKAASRLIESGEVTVNGRPGNHIDHVSDSDQIVISNKPLPDHWKPLYYLYNKPVGIESVCEPGNPNSIVHYLPQSGRVYPVGRLDKDSHGLLLLTNDGELCQRIIHPDFYHEKEYIVEVHRPLKEDFCTRMSAGVCYKNGSDKDIVTRPCKVIQQSEHRFSITLTQGLNRQIRKMAKALGYRVTNLQRIRLVNLTLDQLPENEFRALSPEEVSLLKSTLNPE